MRLKNFLTEDMTPAQWEILKEALEKDCQPYIKELKGAKHALMRGMSDNVKFYTKKTVRQDRKPRFIDEGLHKRLSAYLMYKFRWNPRTEGVFTSTDHYKIKLFGDAKIMFPIGKFKYIYLDDVDRLYYLYDSWDDYEEDSEYKDSLWDEITDELDNYQETNMAKMLKRPFASGNETIIKCKSYYAINRVWFPTLMAYFSQGRGR